MSNGKRYTAKEAVAELKGAVQEHMKHVDKRMTNFEAEIRTEVREQGKIVREHDQQIASLLTIVKNGNGCSTRWRPRPKTVAIGGGTVTIIAGVIIAVLQGMGLL